MTDEKAPDKPRVKVEPQADRPGVVLVTLDRPEVLNALDYRTLGELADALEMLDGDESVRCVVITGAGDRAFAAGGGGADSGGGPRGGGRLPRERLEQPVGAAVFRVGIREVVR